MDNSLLDVRDINHKYIVVGRKLYQPVQSAVTRGGKRYAQPCNRKQRGLYRDRNRKYNADAVGAYKHPEKISLRIRREKGTVRNRTKKRQK